MFGIVAGRAPHLSAADADSAPTVATRLLLDRLEERRMPDVVIWVLDRVVADPSAPDALKDEVPFRRAVALIGKSRTESNAAARARFFDDAGKEIDAFLAKTPRGLRAIDAYTQKGNLNIERGRAKVDQAKKPGADVKALSAEAVAFFDAAIKALEGKVKPDQEITEVTNAEDAVIDAYRGVKKSIAAAKNADPKQQKGRSKSAINKEIEELEELEEQLQVKLIQTRIMAASANFEKSKAFPDGSKEWDAAIDESSKQFKEIADKYPTKGGGVFARYYEGRNYALRGREDLRKSKAPDYKPDPKKNPKENLEKAVSTLAPLTVLDSRSPLGASLRAKSLATTIECWMDLGQLDKLDKDSVDFALTNVPEERVDSDWLTLKQRTAEMLEKQAAGKPEGEKNRILNNFVRRLAMDVAKANRDFAKESRELLARIGKDAPAVAAAEQTFTTKMEEARISLAALQEAQAVIKQQPGTPQAEEAAKKAAAARDKALDDIRKGLRLVTDEDLNAVNQARYLLTYLLYDAQQFHDAATVGAFLLDRYPNAKGSRQAAKIAMVSWQQLQVKQADAGWQKDAKSQAGAIAGRIMQTWPTEPEAADAALIAMAAATEARDPVRILALVEQVPAESPRRAELFLRAGTGLWREVQEDRRLAEADRRPKEETDSWKKAARERLDEAIEALPKEGDASAVQVAGVLARAQIALDDGEAKKAQEFMERAIHGPWAALNDPKADAALREGPFAEAVATVALRCFIQSEAVDKAEEAMKALEKLAGTGDEASAKLTAMYSSMGRDLQGQLEGLAAEAAAGDDAAKQKARDKAAVVLAGFEKFLERLASRDQRVESLMTVATTYLSLGSGEGMGAVVPRAKAQQYLDRAAGVYANLLKKKADDAAPQAERDTIKNFEPSIRLRMADIYTALGKWDESLEQIDWILSDPKRQNSLESQIQAAKLLQSAGMNLAKSDPKAAADRFREAAAGRKKGTSAIWGWAGLANKVARQAFAGNDDKALKIRTQFFEARLNVAACLFERAKLPGATEAADLLSKAENAIAVTRKLYPELGGDSMQKRFEKLLKEIQKQQGNPSPGGFKDLDRQAAAAATATTAAQEK